MFQIKYILHIAMQLWNDKTIVDKMYYAYIVFFVEQHLVIQLCFWKDFDAKKSIV